MLQTRKRSGQQALKAAMALTLGTASVPTPVAAGTIYTKYDSLGRLTRVCNALPGDGEVTQYNLDSADNRSSYSNTKIDFQLLPNSGKNSPDNRFTLWMQPDGNLVLYQNSNGQGLWSTNTVGSGANQAYFQSDGNFVLYAPSQSVWSSGTYSYPCAHLDVQNDGNVVIRSTDDQIVWSSGTGGH